MRKKPPAKRVIFGVIFGVILLFFGIYFMKPLVQLKKIRDSQTVAPALSPLPEPTPELHQNEPMPSPTVAISTEPASFSELRGEVLKSIPTRADLARLNDEEVHFTPESLLEAGRQLGRIAEALEKDSSLAEYGLNFYRTCALSENYPTSIRALCYADLKEILKKQGSALSTFAEDKKIPDDVRKLSEQL